MTPAPQNGPVHRRRLRGDSCAPRPAHGHHRSTVRSTAHARAFAPRPAALWPFADAERLPGTARLAGWLARTIVTLVTGYTRPGDRVLLLAPPTQRSVGRTSGATNAADPYVGLVEAVWTVSRLGRSVDTATAGPPHDDCGGTPDSPGRGDHWSGSGPQLARLGLHAPAGDHSDSDYGLAGSERGAGSGFDLIITAVHPADIDWLSHADWAATLASAGMLAVLTHSSRRHGRLVDPVPAIAATFRSQWRGVLEHIAVLTAHVSGTSNKARPTSPHPAAAGLPDRSSPAIAVDPMPVQAVHHDLLLIGPVPAATPMPGTGSDAGRRGGQG